MAGPVTRLQLEWQAAELPSLFPLMKAELLIYPLTRTENTIGFLGRLRTSTRCYRKSRGRDCRYRIAEVSVHRFVSDVAGSLRQTVGELLDRDERT